MVVATHFFMQKINIHLSEKSYIVGTSISHKVHMVKAVMRDVWGMRMIGEIKEKGEYLMMLGERRR